MTYNVAEIFHSVQGEGVYTGTPMTFIRFVGCSVSKKICHHCDTDFDRTYEWRGGGAYTIPELLERINCDHVCLTGGEPLDQDLVPLLLALSTQYRVHIETSGTKLPVAGLAKHTYDVGGGNLREIKVPEGGTQNAWIWITVSPKPGYLPVMLAMADEIKVIVPGLGNGEGWVTPEQALEIARQFARPVYLQPRNEKDRVNNQNLQLCWEFVMRHPELRLSPQVHKYLQVR